MHLFIHKPVGNSVIFVPKLNLSLVHPLGKKGGAERAQRPHSPVTSSLFRTGGEKKGGAAFPVQLSHSAVDDVRGRGRCGRMGRCVRQLPLNSTLARPPLVPHFLRRDRRPLLSVSVSSAADPRGPLARWESGLPAPRVPPSLQMRRKNRT